MAKKKDTAAQAMEKVMEADKLAPVAPVAPEAPVMGLLEGETMIEAFQRIQAEMKALTVANEALTNKLTTIVVKTGFTPAQENEVRLIIGSLNDPFGKFTLVKRKAFKGEVLVKEWASKYFEGQSILNDCKKAYKDNENIAQAITAGNDKYVELYPTKKKVSLVEFDDKGKPIMVVVDGVEVQKKRKEKKVLADIIDLLNKARSANRKDINLKAHSLPLTEDYTVYYLTDKTDSIDVVRVNEKGMEVIIFGTADKNGLATMLYKEIVTGLDLKHAVTTDIEPKQNDKEEKEV